MIPYLIQANVALILFYALYVFFLKRETSFALMRGYLLLALLAAVVTPVINFRAVVASLFAISPEPAFEATWLPAVTVQAIQVVAEPSQHWALTLINGVYWSGVTISAVLLVGALLKLRRLVQASKMKRDKIGWYYVTENSTASFSFLQYVFFGGTNHTDDEKQAILTHERAHVRLGHSFDVLFVRLVAVMVWFNPIIYWIKHELEVIHEFQADAFTVKPDASNAYCQLLVRETLEGQHIGLANHFNKSLTLKRIAMIQSIKKNMSRARLVGLSALVLLVFAIFSCEEKVMTDLKNAAKRSMLLTEYPETVKQTVDQIKATNLGTEPRVYGLVKNEDMENFIDEGSGPVTIVTVANDPDFAAYVIVGYKQVNQAADYLIEMRGDDEVFTIVEEQAQPVGGMTEFYGFLMQNMRYPVAARNANIEGRVFVNFMVDEMGKLSDFKIVRGIGGGCDEEAIRVLGLSKPWIPAKQRGVAVKSSFNLAVIFKVDGQAQSTGSINAEQKATNQLDDVVLVAAQQDMEIDMKKVNEGGKDVFIGTVKRKADQTPMPGVVIYFKNRTEGTTTNMNGAFKLTSPISTGALMFSFVGFNSHERKF